MQNGVATARWFPSFSPCSDDVCNLGNDFFSITHDEEIHEVGQRFWVVGTVSAGADERVRIIAFRGSYAQSGEVNAVKNIGINKFCRQIKSDDVELGGGSVGVD
jgi:hypothetical protein